MAGPRWRSGLRRLTGIMQSRRRSPPASVRPRWGNTSACTGSGSRRSGGGGRRDQDARRQQCLRITAEGLTAGRTPEELMREIQAQVQRGRGAATPRSVRLRAVPSPSLGRRQQLPDPDYGHIGQEAHSVGELGVRGAGGRTRTDDLLFTRQLLCHLSYAGGSSSGNGFVG